MFRSAKGGPALMDRHSAARYYRALASLLRTHIVVMKSPEARDELAALAESYETLAMNVESNWVAERG